MDHYQYLKYFEKYLQEELNEEEAAEFEARLNSDRAFSNAFEAFKRDLLKENRLLAKNNPDGKTKAWEHVQKNLYHPRRTQIPSAVPAKRNRWTAVAVITTLILLGSLGYLSLQQNIPTPELIVKQTPRGQKSTIVLSDGSRIQLNSESKLVYPKSFDADSRTVSLTGEAFFNVAPDPQRPFVVQSGDIQTHVLGTSFNIQAFPDEDLHEVAVKTGIIRLSFSDDPTETVQLAEGEQLRYRPASRQWDTSPIDPATIAFWADGYLYFDNEPLEEVLKALSRWYDVDYETSNPGILHCRITLKQQNESLHNILEILNYALGFNFELKENKIIVNGTPC